jgi:pyridoxine 5-phosphate synthase
LTSEEGWKPESDAPLVRSAVAVLKEFGCRAVVFIDPHPEMVERVPSTEADGIETYTGSYASAARNGQPSNLLEACAEVGRRAGVLGLAVNIGHDLNLRNLPPLVAALPALAEASIGHELTADALEMGFGAALAAYKAALTAQG